jgi:hypothetical protein
MPTASSTSTRATRRRRKGGAKGATKAAVKGPRRATASTRKTGRAKATRAKAARTRAANQTRAAVSQAQTATRLTVADRSNAFGDYAERAVLIPVGVALTARDRVLSTVTDTISTYSSPTKAQAQLRRFERRGATARNRLEREVRKARVRMERKLRQRRREFERTTRELEGRREAVAKNGSELATRVQERVLSLV